MSNLSLKLQGATCRSAHMHQTTSLHTHRLMLPWLQTNNPSTSHRPTLLNKQSVVFVHQKIKSYENICSISVMWCCHIYILYIYFFFLFLQVHGMKTLHLNSQSLRLMAILFSTFILNSHTSPVKSEFSVTVTISHITSEASVITNLAINNSSLAFLCWRSGTGQTGSAYRLGGDMLK